MQAKAMFADFVQLLGKSYESGKVHEGVFAAMMDVESVNEVSWNTAVRRVLEQHEKQ